MPNVSVEGDVLELAADPESLELLEQCVINWLSQISTALESQLKKTPQVITQGSPGSAHAAASTVPTWAPGTLGSAGCSPASSLYTSHHGSLLGRLGRLEWVLRLPGQRRVHAHTHTHPCAHRAMGPWRRSSFGGRGMRP